MNYGKSIASEALLSIDKLKRARELVCGEEAIPDGVCIWDFDEHGEFDFYAIKYYGEWTELP